MGYRDEIFNGKPRYIVICDYCRGDSHIASKEFIDKLADMPPVKCKNCSLVELRGGVAIPGYGAITKMQIETKSQEIEAKVNDAKPAQIKKKKSADTIAGINWASIDALITSGSLKIANLAKEMSVQPNDLKDAIVSHYGNRIEFRRGRSGGCFWRNLNQQKEALTELVQLSEEIEKDTK